jgi:hypothetical protein
VIGSTPAEFAAVIKEEGQQSAKVIKERGLKAGNQVLLLISARCRFTAAKRTKNAHPKLFRL